MQLSLCLCNVGTVRRSMIGFLSFLSPTACLHVACVVQQKDARQWFAELSVDMDKVRLIICLPGVPD